MPKYNDYDKYNIGLTQPVFTPATFQAATFTPQTADLSLLQKSLAQIEERKDKTLQQTNALRAAIGKVQLNEAEDAWKTNYINDIQNQIDQAAQLGDYSTALNVATTLAGRVASDPALLGRERANAKYQEEFRRIQADNTLDTLTKQRWAALNPYSYEDVKDDKGNIVGGTQWAAKFNPVADVDINKLRALAVNMAAEESGSSGGTTTRQTLLDADGKEIKDPSKNFDKAYDIKMTTSKGGSNQFAKKDKEKMARVWNSLKADSKILQGLNQKYETYRWAYEDAQKRVNDSSLSQKERERAAREVDSYKSEICDKDGIIYTNAETWAQSRIIPGFADMEYNNRHTRGDSSITYNENYFTAKKAGLLQAANNADVTVTEDAGVTGTKIRNNYDYVSSWQRADAFDFIYSNDNNNK